MKRFSHFLSEARDAEDAIYGRRGAEKRRREQKERVMKKARNRLNQVTAHDGAIALARSRSSCVSMFIELILLSIKKRVSGDIKVFVS